jgi:hypothetical protein
MRLRVIVGQFSQSRRLAQVALRQAAPQPPRPTERQKLSRIIDRGQLCWILVQQALKIFQRAYLAEGHRQFNVPARPGQPGSFQQVRFPIA